MAFAFHLISKPHVDFHTLLKVAFDGTGKKLAAFADGSNRPFTDDKKFATCLSALIDQDPVSLHPMVATHLHFAGLLVCEELDLIDVLQAGGKLAYLGTPASKARGAMIAFLSGTLGDWRDAVISGLLQPTTQPIFETVYRTFISAGYASAWAGYREVVPIGGQLKLEAKR
ncbi:MAG: hypothetical protein ACTHOU_18980 [Aureliella sp.]